jgi:GDP-L-fucose synthase
MIDYTKEKVLITGSSGFLGSHLVNLFKKYKIKVFAVNSNQFDLTKLNQTKKMFEKYKPTIVFSLAAKVGGILDNKNFKADFYYKNILINAYMFELCKKFRVKKLINVGAGCGYPLLLKEPLREEKIWDGFPQVDSAPYSMAKKMILLQSIAYKEQYGLNSVTIIPSNLYGEYDNFNLQKSHVIPALVRKFYESKKFNKKNVEIWGSGRAQRDFIHACDVAKALFCVGKLYNNVMPLNICIGKQYSLKFIANILKKISGFDGQIIWNKNMPEGQKSRQMSRSNQKKKLKIWKPNVSISSGLLRTYDWFEKNYNTNDIRL